MKCRHLALLGLCWLLCSAAAAAAQKPARPASKSALAPRIQTFVGALDDARAEARARNVPLLLVVLQPGIDSSDIYLRETFFDPGLVASAASCVVVLASEGEHAQREVEFERDGQRIKESRCALFEVAGGCANHRRAVDESFKLLREGDQMRSPQTAIVLPDGSFARRLIDQAAPGTVIEALETAKAQLGPGITHQQRVELEELHERALDELRAGEEASAWRAWLQLLATNERIPLAGEARAKIELCRAPLLARLQAARERLAQGAIAEGYAALFDLHLELKGLPLEAQLASELAAADKRREWKAAIAQWKQEREASDLWAQAQALFEAKELKQAQALLRRLFKNYASSAAAAEARRQYPEFELAKRTGG